MILFILHLIDDISFTLQGYTTKDKKEDQLLPVFSSISSIPFGPCLFTTYSSSSIITSVIVAVVSICRPRAAP